MVVPPTTILPTTTESDSSEILTDEPILPPTSTHDVDVLEQLFQSDPYPPILHPADSSAVVPPQQKLELNEKGQLRLGTDGPVLLDGLSPKTWTAMAPTASSSSSSLDTSLFLRARHDRPSDTHELSLGNLVACQRLMACARLNRYWMGPAFGTSAQDIPLDTQFLLVELETDKSYALFLPLVDSGFRATLQGSSSAAAAAANPLQVVCYSESGDPSVRTRKDATSSMLALYVAVGDNPYALLQQGFRQVADETQTFCTLDQKKVPPSVDEFGWCTWDAFYSKVTPQGILEGVEALTQAGTPPRNVILDDGWQVVTPYPQSWKNGKQKIALKNAKPAIVLLAEFLSDKVAETATDYYQDKVEKAPHGSIHNRIWTFLAKTVLKAGLWNFFDTQTDFARQLGGFEPNFKFEKSNDDEHSNGVSSLKDLVSKLKTELNVKHVYCWHAIHGYWRGVSNELGKSIGIDVTQIFPKPTKHMLQLEPQAEFDPPSLFGVGLIQKEEDLATFYKHIHAPLVKAGVDGVKVDVQSGVTAAGSGVGGGPHIARLYTQAMENSVAQNFAAKDGSIHTINCMCHSSENLYRYKVTALARASEDFFPDQAESHSVHLVNVAYNSVYLGNICLPDWDMFHSLHESAELHAAARAIGGCPLYVSDRPGEHNTTLLKKLVMPDGSILRAQLPGRPTRDCLFADVGQDETSALKVWNQNKAGTGVVGAFHVQGVAWNFDEHCNEVLVENPPPLTTSVRPYDVETLRNHKGDFAVWRHQEQKLQVLPSGDQSIEKKLDSHGWEIFSISPIQTTDSVRWAPIGLGNMMNSGGALESVGPLEESLTTSNSTLTDGYWRQSTTTEVRCRGPGRFVAYCQPAPTSVMIKNGEDAILTPLDFSYDSETGLLSFDLPREVKDRQAHELTLVWDDTFKH